MEKEKQAKEKRAKYILIGMAIGIVIGIAIFYLLMTFGIIQPFGFGNFGPPSGMQVQ